MITAMGFEEEEIFWMISLIVETHAPIDYYTTMYGVLVD